MANKEINILVTENNFLRRKVALLTEILKEHNISVPGPTQENLAICINDIEIPKLLYNNLQKFFNRKKGSDAMIMPKTPIKITIDDLHQLSRKSLMDARGFGIAQISELEKILAKYHCELLP
jgi:hypothetical protein